MSTYVQLALRPAADCRWDFVSLGEVMLRFDPGEHRIASARSFNVWEGGGEYNVARGLRTCFRQRTSVVTALVDNPVGRLIESMIQQAGVDTEHIHWSSFDGIGRDARNGVYFLERGFGVRGGLGMMDRGATAISQLQPGQVDWDKLFGEEGVRWFHTGGIMAALSGGSTELVADAMAAARRHGTLVSFDCNYRPSLWKSRGGRQGSIQVNRRLLQHVDVLFGHEGDVASTLGPACYGPVWHTLGSFAPMADRVLREFAGLKLIASTVRKPMSANRNQWSAFAYAAGKAFQAIAFDDLEILDRVGGGDSFVAGLVYGLLNGRDVQWSLDCGVAHGALAMTTAGDSSFATLAEVEHLMQGGGAGTNR